MSMIPRDFSASPRRLLLLETTVDTQYITARAVTAETVLLLAKRFGTSAGLWMNLQTAHDLAVAREPMAA